MKIRLSIITIILCMPLLPLRADIVEDALETGYRIEITNQTYEPLEGYVYLALAANNKHSLSLPARHTTILWSGKVSEQLTAGEMALFNMTGQIIGATATAVVGAKTEYELPGGAGDAAGAGLAKLVSFFNTCVAGFEFIYKGKKYEYQFGNGCTSHTLMLRPINFGTELGVFTGDGRRESWGNVTKMRA